jgi:hypothetical protein
MVSTLPKSLIDDSLVSERVAAEFLGLACSTLSAWRSLGRYDLPYHKAGRLVRYKISDLKEFLAKRRHDGQQNTA